MAGHRPWSRPRANGVAPGGAAALTAMTVREFPQFSADPKELKKSISQFLKQLQAPQVAAVKVGLKATSFTVTTSGQGANTQRTITVSVRSTATTGGATLLRTPTTVAPPFTRPAIS